MYRVLIVDDEALMREALRLLVSRVEGFVVAGCVSSGEEALEICAQEKIHIVFMDLIMPGICGVDASKEIYRIDPTITIYIISAFHRFDFAREALKAKIRDYISKPVSYQIIANLLEGYRQEQGEEEDQRDLLLSVLHERQYGKISSVVPAVVRKIFREESKHQDRIRNRFAQIAQDVLRMVNPIDAATINLDEMFPVNDVFGRERISWVFWLSDIMDYAFRQAITKKYAHLQTVFQLIDLRLKENLGLNMISNACNISQSYLSKLFKQYMGVSVMDYIHMRKIKQAKMYFAFTSMNTTDIGYHMGYNESSYFSKVFKKYEGMTPQQYKKAVSQAKNN